MGVSSRVIGSHPFGRDAYTPDRIANGEYKRSQRFSSLSPSLRALFERGFKVNPSERITLNEVRFERVESLDFRVGLDEREYRYKRARVRLV